MNRVEILRLDISYEMLLEDLEEVGDETSINGRYPINYAIRQRLTKLSKANEQVYLGQILDRVF